MDDLVYIVQWNDRKRLEESKLTLVEPMMSVAKSCISYWAYGWRRKYTTAISSYIISPHESVK